MVVHPAFWQVVSRAALGPEDICLNCVQAFGMWFLDRVCEEHIGDLSRIVTNASRIQLFHDAALDWQSS